MQLDFHFYTIYTLCRATGFSHENAFTVAYSSQYVDDAKHEDAFEFENGGYFQPVSTAHRFFSPDVISDSVCYGIWVPFHFLPGGLGTEFYERMLVRANSVIAQEMIDHLLNSPLRSYTLHRLGITLHVYADTWSHQNFMDVIKENINDVKDLKVEGETEDFITWFIDKLKEKIPEYALPKLGHAQAGTIPDEPFRIWEYTDYKGIRHRIINSERALDAAQNCYRILLKFLEKFPIFQQSEPVPWIHIAPELKKLFETKGELDERCNAWKQAILNEKFGFKVPEEGPQLEYDERLWFKAAVEVEEDIIGRDRYIRREGFERSNWKYFHDAAALHKFVILHEILPEHGIICG